MPRKMMECAIFRIGLTSMESIHLKRDKTKPYLIVLVPSCGEELPCKSPTPSLSIEMQEQNFEHLIISTRNKREACLVSSIRL